MHEDGLAIWFDGSTPSVQELVLLLAFAVVVIDLALAAFGAASERKHARRGGRLEAR
jgi:hypothetical protein